MNDLDETGEDDNTFWSSASTPYGECIEALAHEAWASGLCNRIDSLGVDGQPGHVSRHTDTYWHLVHRGVFDICRVCSRTSIAANIQTSA